jgi:bacillithiol system protein YtxJ
MQAQMHAIPLVNLTELDDALARSHREPVLLFLDDPYCPISRRAAVEVSALDQPVFRIDVSSEHAMSRAVEECTGVPHASPQLLLLMDGQAVWSASHRRVTATAVMDELAKVKPSR